jgi:endonuclease-3
MTKSKTSAKRAGSGGPTWSTGENRAPERLGEILDRLEGAYPKAHLLLEFENAFQLLGATILAARATDEKVNEVTPELFSRFPDAKSLAAADFDEVAEIVHPTGFFRQKAKRLIEASQALVDDFGGEVPETVEELTTLPGVGRKTAILVINHAFGKAAGVVVDTHVQRISGRLDWSHEKNADKMERELRELVPEERWIAFQDLVGAHGRAHCTAPKPRCEDCPIDELCYFPEKVYR